jgi:hypothetical protein
MTINATDVSAAAVQAAINKAKNGDQVMVPAGNATWTSPVTVKAGITLAGAGVGKTVITNTATQGQGNSSLQISLNSTATFKLTGFDFRGQNAINLSGTPATKPFWIESCNFDNGMNNTVFCWFNGNCYGLIDLCTFSSGGGSEMLHNMGYGASSDAGWQDDCVPGSIQMVVIEDCTFSKNPYIDDYFWGTAILESYYGARTVLRHCKLNYCDIDQHGTAGSIGARWFEFYDNTFYMPPHGSTDSKTPPNQFRYIILRGGSGLVFNNKVVFEGLANVGGGLAIYEEDLDNQQVKAGQNSPELYQPGRGIKQNLSPIYHWNNIDGNGSAWDVGLNGSSENPPLSYANTNVVADRDVIAVTGPKGLTKSQASADGGGISTKGTTYDYVSLSYPHPLRSESGTPPPEGGGTPPPEGGGTPPVTPEPPILASGVYRIPEGSTITVS